MTFFIYKSLLVSIAFGWSHPGQFENILISPDIPVDPERLLAQWLTRLPSKKVSRSINLVEKLLRRSSNEMIWNSNAALKNNETHFCSIQAMFFSDFLWRLSFEWSRGDLCGWVPSESTSSNLCEEGVSLLFLLETHTTFFQKIWFLLELSS